MGIGRTQVCGSFSLRDNNKMIEWDIQTVNNWNNNKHKETQLNFFGKHKLDGKTVGDLLKFECCKTCENNYLWTTMTSLNSAQLKLLLFLWSTSEQ
jgi:hypothetical protein